MKRGFPMWLPKWFVPILALVVAMAGGGSLFAKDAVAPGVIPAPSGIAASRAPGRFSEEVQSQGIFLRTPGVWLDPPPDAMGVPAEIPRSTWYPPYDDAVERYRDAQRSMYLRQRDLDHRRQESWMDSICPLPKRQPAWPAQGRYPRQIEGLDQWYRDAFPGQRLLGYPESWGR